MAFADLPTQLTEKYSSAARIIRRPFPINVALSSYGYYDYLQATQHNYNPNGRCEEAFHLQGSARKISDDQLFVGIAGFKSLDLLALLGKDHQQGYKKAVLIDMNEQQIHVMQEVLKLISAHDAPGAFIEAFSKNYAEYMQMPATIPAGKRDDFFTVFGSSYIPPPEQVRGILRRFSGLDRQAPKLAGRETSWLEPEHYRKIREMVLKDDIVLANIDMRDEKRMHMLKGWLDAQQLKVGDMYLSSNLDYIDPSLKTDYYSSKKDYRVKLAHGYYANLLSLADDRTHFVVSNPSGEPMLQSYQLQQLTVKDIQKLKSDLPDRDPGYLDKRCSMLFTAGGHIWRLNSFTRQVPGVDGKLMPQQYFRIFSELPAVDPEGMKKQIGIINDTLQNQQDNIRALRIIPPAEYPQKPTDDEAFFRDIAFFEKEAKLLPQEAKYALFSSNPFTYGQSTGAATLDHVIKNVQNELNAASRGAAR